MALFNAIRDRFNSEDEDSSINTDYDHGGERQTAYGYRPPRDPSSVTDDADAEVTAISASSAQLLTHGSRTGSKYAKTIYTTWIPPNPSPGILDALTTHSSAGVTSKVTADPMPREDALKVINIRYEVVKRKLRAARESDSADVQQWATEKERTEHLRSAVQGGSERMFWVGVFATVRADTKEQVDEATKNIQRGLRKENVRTNVTGWQPVESLRTTAPLGEVDLPSGVLTPMSASALGRLYPFGGSDLIEPSGVLFGYHCQTRSPVVVDHWQRPQGHNMLVVGGIGNGKTVFQGLLFSRWLAKDPNLRGVIVDPRGGYKDLVEAFGGESHRVGGQSVCINPLDIQPTPDEVFKREPDHDPYNRKIQNLMGFFGTAYAQNSQLVGGGQGDSGGDPPLTKEELATLHAALPYTYEKAEITRDPETHHRDSPVIEDLYETLYYIEDDPEAFLREIDYPSTPISVSNFEEAAGTLRMGLQPFRGDGQYAHLNGETNVELKGKLTRFDLQQAEDSESLPLDMTLIFNLLYEWNKRPGKTVNAFDEAHYLLKNPYGTRFLERSIRYSRHFDASFSLLTQSAEDFVQHRSGRTIAGNCSVSVFFRDDDLTIGQGEHLNLSPREVRFIKNAIPGDRSRGYSQCLLRVKDVGVRPLRIEGLPSEMQLIDPPTEEERQFLSDDQLVNWTVDEVRS